MIREIINFVKDLEDDYPEVFELNKTPSPGLHLWVELDEEGNWKNNPPVEGEDYVVYDGKNKNKKLFHDAIRYWEQGRTVGGATNTNKCIDDKKIHSCSPYILAFKNENFKKLTQKIINTYFEKAQIECLEIDQQKYIQKSKTFCRIIPKVLVFLEKMNVSSKHNNKELSILKALKSKDYINIYFRNIELCSYKLAHDKYLNNKLFNNNNYCFPSTSPIEDSYGLSNFINGAKKKKMFLEHKTGVMLDGISYRITMDDAKTLNKYEILEYQRALPKPLPLIIDKRELKYDKKKVTNSEIIKLFDAENKRRTFPQILKSLFDENPQRVLANYYLLYIVGTTVYDFDFVSKFEYKLDIKIENLFAIKQKEDLAPVIQLRTIFDFERSIVSIIFNNSLIKTGEDKIDYRYFDDINPKYVHGGEEMASLILRYRKAFYDFIYKSQKQAITTSMFNSLMLSSILLDVKQDEEFNKDQQIKRKLNIWLSLSQFFINHKSINMATQFQDLMDKMDKIANDDNFQLDQNLQEFLFASGQVIYFLLWHNKADKPSHAMLEPFIQKSSVEQLQIAITNAVNTYKHDISFGKGRFERLCSQVLTFNSKENIKSHQRYILAGYFAPAVILKKNEK